MLVIDKIIKYLIEDKIIAIPTDTIYGLIGNPFSKIAVDKVYQIKNRDYSKKLSIFLKNKEEIKKICKTNNFIDDFIEKKLENNTIILEKKDENYLNLISNKKIGIRIPDDKFLLDLLNKYNQPIFATSVNTSNEKELNSYNKIFEKFNNKIDLIIDGDLKNRTSSKIFEIENNNIKRIR